MRSVSLDCLSLPDVAPVDLVAIAGECGYGACSLWVQPPAMYDVMLATPAMRSELEHALAERGVVLGNLEVFNLNSEDPVDACAPALALGAQLGAGTATAIDFGPPRDDIAERFAAFQRLCADHGLRALLEPISMGNVRTLRDGVEVIERARVEGALVVDCVHLVRTGGGADTLRATPRELVGHVQVCDGPAAIAPDDIGVEATANRLYPGEGDFPLADILAAVPPGATVGVEVPNLARLQQGVPALERAAEAFAATGAVLDDAVGEVR